MKQFRLITIRRELTAAGATTTVEMTGWLAFGIIFLSYLASCVVICAS